MCVWREGNGTNKSCKPNADNKHVLQGLAKPCIYLIERFTLENRSAIAGNRSRNGIYGLSKRSGIRKFTGMYYCLITVYIA